MKFVVIGATGQTGKVVAKTLQAAGHDVRAVVRSAAQTQSMFDLGYEAVIAHVDDVPALTAAFTDVDGVYLMNPPAYFEVDMFAKAHTVHAALLAAVKAAHVPHVVALSSVGGQHATGTGNIGTNYDFEQQIHASGQTVSILRAPNFLDNWASAIASAKEKGILPSMFIPLNKKWPMASSLDIGVTAARLLMANKAAPTLTELHGPEDYSAQDAAEALSELLGKPIQAIEVPTDTIAAYFENLGFPNVTAQAFQEMMYGFNTDHIVFSGEGEAVYGNVSIKEAFALLLSN
ncbi:NmrA family NAD(P)-binding protein [Photobacterium sagamiensis]|uniref:NmrA family NAD(P)-binding protein n=1 Tax=Photobacterium sagamiensis TaxID=2910241 RepID=UPI003D0E3E57